MTKEEWRDIPGYENMFQASNLGNIRSLDRYVNHQRNGKTLYKGKILSMAISNVGYYHVALSKDGKSKGFTVHRLVCYAFFGIKESLVINHKNGIKTDNRIENLEYCTQSENNIHAYRTGLKKPPRRHGSKNSNSCFTSGQVKEIRERYAKGGVTHIDLSLIYGCCEDTIRNMLKKRYYKYE